MTVAAWPATPRASRATSPPATAPRAPLPRTTTRWWAPTRAAASPSAPTAPTPARCALRASRGSSSSDPSSVPSLALALALALARCPGPSFSPDSTQVRACESCDISCATCSGGTAADCASCPVSGTPFKAATSCVGECPPREYADSGGSCGACSDQCSNCSGTATNCTSCPAYAPYLHGASCAGSCPIGSFASGYTCLACDASCITYAMSNCSLV